MISGIIGKGGATIKDLTARSGATIKISQKDDITASGERTVTVTGTSEAVSAAQQLIEAVCKEMIAANSTTGGDGKRERENMASVVTSVTDGGGLGDVKRARTEAKRAEDADAIHSKILLEHKVAGQVIGKQGAEPPAPAPASAPTPSPPSPPPPPQQT